MFIPRTKVDLSSITGKYQLLALFLIVVEGLLGLWIGLAENTTERIIAGTLCTVLLIGFFVTLIILSKQQDSIKGIPSTSLGTVSPAKREVTDSEIQSNQPDVLVAPDRSYIINRPPDNWIIHEMLLNEWLAWSFQIHDPDIKAKLKETNKQEDRQIIILEAPQRLSVIPIPNHTAISSRKLYTALEFPIATRLSIIPMDRAYYPLFVELPLIHTFMTVVAEILGLGVLPIQNISTGKIHPSGREYISAEFYQDIENAIINQQDGQNIRNNTTVIGIKGEVLDYLLIMTYPSSLPESNDRVLYDLDILKSLVSSFKPLRTSDPKGKRLENCAKADSQFHEVIKNNGSKMFQFEFMYLLLRFSGTNLDDNEECLKAMRLFKPFRIFAQEIGLSDPNLSEFWEALQEAEGGNFLKFKAILTTLIQAAKEEATQTQSKVDSES
jgi:hypothetical protein